MHLTEKSFTKFLLVSHVCLTHQEAFSVVQISFFSFVVSVLFKRHSLFTWICLMFGEELMMHSCFIFFFFSMELMHLGF